MNKVVFIIGAGRSGTNLLRDAISAHPDIGTWPCDEINYIFKHRKLFTTYNSDRLSKRDCDRKTQKYLLAEFSKIKSDVVLEKTCANSLRVSYLEKNFPEAKFIFIYRNGKDVVLSAKNRWKGSVDSKYLSKKLNFVPWNDLWFHVSFQIFNKLWKFFRGTYYRWGPHVPTLSKYNNIQLKCANQWASCIHYSLEDFRSFEDPSKLHCINFDELITDLNKSVLDCLEFIDVPSETYPVNYLANLVNSEVKNRSKPEIHLFSKEEQLIFDSAHDKIDSYLESWHFKKACQK